MAGPGLTNPATLRGSVDVRARAERLIRELQAALRGLELEVQAIQDAFVWKTWSPTYTNLTIGNGTTLARYLEMPQGVVLLRWNFTLGSTSAVGTNPTISLPVPAVSTYVAASESVGTVVMLDSGVRRYEGKAYINSSTVLGLHQSSASLATTAQASINATAPMTWVATDAFFVTAWYEKA